MIVRDGGAASVRGPLTLHTVVALRNEGAVLLQAGDVVVDLGKVTEVDSSALSLLLEWRRVAQQHKVNITYRNFPPNLTSLATLYGVGELIGQ